jgi:hypothetical protein
MFCYLRPPPIDNPLLLPPPASFSLDLARTLRAPIEQIHESERGYLNQLSENESS